MARMQFRLDDSVQTMKALLATDELINDDYAVAVVTR
jgi:hypothetical protein